MSCRLDTTGHAILNQGKALHFSFHSHSVLDPRRDLQFCANVRADLKRIIVDEMPDAVVWDASNLSPFPKSAN